VLGLPLVALALLLMRGEPDASARWKAGIGIAVLLAIVYLAEEIVWMVQRRGRPCAGCGERIHLRPFSLRIRCPHCGEALR
jgi:formate hydrogenlyase subunit 3/multisubunit Na+/H+ antiporter MnhD subunit